MQEALKSAGTLYETGSIKSDAAQQQQQQNQAGSYKTDPITGV